MPLNGLVHNPPVLFAMDPAELAGYLLEHLNALPEGERERLNRYSFRALRIEHQRKSAEA